MEGYLLIVFVHTEVIILYGAATVHVAVGIIYLLSVVKS